MSKASSELTIPLSYGPSPVTDYIAEFTTDVVIHGWDLARGIGADDTIEPALLEPVYRRSLAGAEFIRGSGMVATDVEAPGGRRRPDQAARDLGPSPLGLEQGGDPGGRTGRAVGLDLDVVDRPADLLGDGCRQRLRVGVGVRPCSRPAP